MAIDNPPPYHSGMTTLDPATETALLELIEANLHRPGLGMKDSFHCLDLAARGLIEHFAATAIRSDARQAEDTIGWHRKISGDDLELWETAWKAGGSSSGQRQFTAAILSRPEVVIWGRSAGCDFDAGIVDNRSKDCVGLSNCFGKGAVPTAAALCAALAPEPPVVGYETGRRPPGGLFLLGQRIRRLRLLVGRVFGSYPWDIGKSGDDT